MLDELFDEEGFSTHVAAVCPACRAEMAADAVFCTKCGYNKESGERLVAHQTAGVDIDDGALALQKAESDLIKDYALQQKMLKGSGLPWWGLALVLFLAGSGLSVAVLAQNARKRVVEGPTTDPMAMFLVLCGGGCSVVASGAYLMVLVRWQCASSPSHRHCWRRATYCGLGFAAVD